MKERANGDGRSGFRNNGDGTITYQGKTHRITKRYSREQTDAWKLDDDIQRLKLRRELGAARKPDIAQMRRRLDALARG